ncbi:hypothetical protein ACQ4PT_008435 [Festuca glaucescens]
MKVLYTNMASSVESWLVKAEGVLDASARKIVGLDVEYDKSLPVHNLKDIQQIWRDPEKSWKRTQGLKDVVAAIIDPYYEQMKDGFGNTEHNMWANAPPLPEKHLEYAARDAYATYEVYRSRTVFLSQVELLLVYFLYFPKNVCAPSIDEAAAPISQEDSLPEGAPSIDEAAAPISQEISLPEDAPSVEDAPSIADASLDVEPAGDTLAQLIAEQEKVARKKLRAYERRKFKDSTRAPVLGGDFAAKKELRSKSVHDTHALDPNSDVVPANELRSKRVHDHVDDVGDMSDEPIPEKELRSKRVHDPVDHISLLIRAKERRSKAIHDDEATNIDVKKLVSKKNPVAKGGADNLKAKASAKPKPNANDKAKAKAKAKANVNSVSFKDDEDDFVDAAGEGSSDDESDDDIEKVHKEKTDVDGDSDETESDYVGDGKEDIEGGKDDLNDAKEDLQDGTGGDDAFVEHGATPLPESPVASPGSQIVPFESVEKAVATPDTMNLRLSM